MRLPLAILALFVGAAGMWALVSGRLFLSLALEFVAALLSGLAFYRPKPSQHPLSMRRDTHFD